MIPAVASSPTRPELIVNGEAYSGWLALTLTRSLESVEHTLEARTIDRWADAGDPVPIRRGDEYELRFDGELLSTGFVDDVSTSFEADSLEVAISAFSWTADLVDSSASDAGPSWKDTKIDKIAADLADGFMAGITVDGELGAALARFRAEPDETVIDAVLKLATARGLLVYTQPDGNLTLTTASKVPVGFKIVADRVGGRNQTNVLSGNSEGSQRERFSEYFVTSQNSHRSNFQAQQASGALYKATDEQILRHRPLVVRANTQETSLEARGNWERNVRRARSHRFVYTVGDWQYEAGRCWAPNLLVPVDDELLDVQGELLLATATLSVGDQGTLATLELVPPNAFDAQPPRDPKTKRRRRSVR